MVMEILLRILMIVGEFLKLNHQLLFTAAKPQALFQTSRTLTPSHSKSCTIFSPTKLQVFTKSGPSQTSVTTTCPSTKVIVVVAFLPSSVSPDLGTPKVTVWTRSAIEVLFLVSMVLPSSWQLKVKLRPSFLPILRLTKPRPNLARSLSMLASSFSIKTHSPLKIRGSDMIGSP